MFFTFALLIASSARSIKYDRLEANISSFLGLLSDDIKNKIVSWEIVVGDRTEDNKTILDKGFTSWNENKRVDNTKGLGGSNFVENGKIITFYSPKILFNKAALNPTHYKVEMYNSSTALLSNTMVTGHERQLFGNGRRDWVREFYDVIGKYDDINTTKRLSNFKVDNPIYINDTKLATDDKSTWVQGQIPGIQSLEGTRNYNYTPHAWRFISNTGRFINNPLGQWLPSNAKGYITYGSIKKERSVYENLSDITYLEYKNSYDPSTVIIKVKEGDTFISPFTVEISSYVDYRPRQAANGGTVITDSTLEDPIHDVYYTWVESEINTALRHRKNVFNKKDNEIYHQGWVYSDGTTATIFSPKGYNLEYSFYDYIVEMFNEDNPQINIEIKPLHERAFKQALLYNKDYNAIKSVKPFLALSNLYNYNNAQKKNLYKIRYSEKSFQDTIYDNYRTFLNNNAVTQDAQQGEIIDLFVDKNELYSRTNKSVLFIPTNTQTVKTNESTFYLGNAQVLPYEPKALNTLSYSNGGGLLFTHRLVTEYGTVLIDLSSSKIFILRDGLKDISGEFSNFFLSFLKSELLDISSYSKDDKIVLYYDTLHKRLMLTYKGRKIDSYWGNLLRCGELKITNYDGELFTLKGPGPHNSERIELLSLDQLTQGYSFTVSYSFMTESWTSFHSYTPDYAFETSKGFIQFSDNNIWAHQTNKYLAEPYLNFNDSRYPFIVEYTINEEPQYTKILGSLNLYSDNINWSEMYAYTHNQNTGNMIMLPINMADNATLNQVYGHNISGYEGYFRVDRIIDRLNDVNVGMWSFNNRLDKTINTDNIQSTATMYQGSLRGKWIRVRLKYNTTNDNLNKQYIWLSTSTVDLINR